MLKTIKRTKQMRLDELIKYVWDNLDDLLNGYGAMLFYSRDGKGVTFDDAGLVECDDGVDKDDLFEVEIEEEITEDTEFEKCVVIFKDKSTISTPLEHNIKFIKKYYKNIKYIYALIDGKLELIWEVEDNEIHDKLSKKLYYNRENS